jgi:DNA-binding LacI/PurR family transcriptional regulator
LAVGAFIAIKELGLSIPQDVGLIGFSDEPIMSLLSPPVSSVFQPAFEMGKLAVKLFIEQVHSEELTIPSPILLKPKLIVRESTNLR